MTARSILAAALLIATPACADLVEPDGLAMVEAPIVNGTDAPVITSLTAGERLAIGFLASPSGAPFCSGTVIDDDVVMTALHCVDDKAVEDLRFGVGHPASPHDLFEVKRASLSYWEHDVALLQLDRRPTIAVAGLTALPFNREPLGSWLIGEDVEISGYHAVSGDSHRRFAVLEVTNVMTNAITADGNGLQGACQGDSGGPFLVHDGLGQPLVGGTIIGGHNSCLQHAYLSRADRIQEWIDEELAWFASSADDDAGGPSAGERRFLDPWGCSGGGRDANGAHWATLVMLGWLVSRACATSRRSQRARMSSTEKMRGSRLTSTPISPRRHLDVRPACPRWRHDDLDALAGRRYPRIFSASDI